MTEREAIKQLKWLMQEHPTISRDNDFVQPLQSAISALEKQIELETLIEQHKKNNNKLLLSVSEVVNILEKLRLENKYE